MGVPQGSSPSWFYTQLECEPEDDPGGRREIKTTSPPVTPTPGPLLPSL
eukprot:CAMPEP_0196753054 /NCGR_PEP_ID=MMETSP1091-20130531/89387_1 /TAXON_ID=302021 /ORGANISM="Rhodomonas sp., Strain CCMP768" /LENGTH=48 /DNA_ID= /DNA_START= /DNA_END= /DNA_ORIENTATION=